MASPRHERDQFFVGATQPFCQFRSDDGDDFVARCGVGFHEGQHGGVIDDGHAGWLHGVDGCGRDAGWVEQVDFTKESARAEPREQDFFAVGVTSHLHHAVADEVEVSDGSAFLENELVRLNVVGLQNTQEGGEFRVIKILEQGDGAKKGEVHDPSGSEESSGAERGPSRPSASSPHVARARFAVFGGCRGGVGDEGAAFERGAV